MHYPTPPPTSNMIKSASETMKSKPINNLIYSEPIPNYYKLDHPWNIDLVEAPECPSSIEVIRLIKTAPFNFAFREELNFFS